MVRNGVCLMRMIAVEMLTWEGELIGYDSNADI